MKNQNFYMRVICLLLVVAALLFYNNRMQATENAKEIENLSSQVDILQTQQNELLSALQESYEERLSNQSSTDSSSSEDTSSEDSSDSDSSSDESDSDADSSDESDSDASSSQVYKDGSYTGEAQGYGGTIQVEVTLASDEITDIQVTSASGEDSAYLSQAEAVIDSVISAQSTDVDTVSGATFSSTGILNAIDEALGKAEN